VSWTAPASNGGGAITGYTVTSSPGGLTASVNGSTTTTTVTGLTNGTAYTFTATATNAVGTGPASATSNSVTPITVPGAPTGVTATAGNAQATVTWTTPASNGGSAITAYTVTASPGGKTATVSGTTTTAVVTGLTNGVAYTFTVTATNAAGTSAASAVSNTITPATVPGAPTSVTGRAGAAQATVSWKPPASNGGSAITGYTVTSTPGGLIATVSVGTNAANVTGLTNGTAYTFTVTATNTVGTGPSSVASNSLTPATVPGAPTGTAATVGVGQATVSWAAPASNGGSAISGYTVTSSPGGLTASVGGGTTTAIVTGLTGGTAYIFSITASNAMGSGPASTASSPVTPTSAVPGAPIGVRATAGNAQASVSWTAPASNGGSAITAYTVTSSPGGLTASGSGNVTTATVTGLTNGTTYTFTVTATNAIGIGPGSAPSNSVTPTTGSTVPGPPQQAIAFGSTGSAFVSWSPPTSDGGSPILDYTVTPSGGPGSPATTTGTSLTVTGLTNETTYTFSVVARNANGSGLAVTTTAVVVEAPVGTPINVTATVNGQHVTVAWSYTPPAGSAAQTFLRVSGSAFPYVKTVPLGVSSTTFDGVERGTYFFNVSATNALSVGAPAISPTVTVAAAPLTFTTVVTGGMHSLAIAADGTLWGWGTNFDGQLGCFVSEMIPPDPCESLTLNHSTGLVPVYVYGGMALPIKAIAAGLNFSLAVDANGRVWSWGDKLDGPLGLDLNMLPVPVVVPSGMVLPITSVAAGDRTAYALDSSGQVWAWGNNDGGQLGDGTTTLSATPVKVALPVAATAIAASSHGNTGADAPAALDSSGHAWAWGNYHPTGHTSTLPIQVPVPSGMSLPLKQVMDGPQELDASGHLWAAGGTTAACGTADPVQVPFSGSIAAALPGSQLFEAGAFNCIRSELILDTGGKVWELFTDGNIVPSTIAIAIENFPTPAILPIQSISTDGVGGVDQTGHSLVLDSAGRLWNWGINNDWELADGTQLPTAVPEQPGHTSVQCRAPGLRWWSSSAGLPSMSCRPAPTAAASR
jgi:hypothetical protein